MFHKINLQELETMGGLRRLVLYGVLLAVLMVPSVSIAKQTPVKAAVVKTVIDTCTLEVKSGKKVERVRLLNLLPMELTRPADRLKLKELAVLQDLQTELTGKTVYLEFDTKQRDEKKRLLAYVWLAKPQKRDITAISKQMLNARLLLNGYAEWYPVKPNYKYISQLLTMETDAYFARRGLWAN
jgi:endonuclease YncB( thermonuclease family)